MFTMHGWVLSSTFFGSSRGRHLPCSAAKPEQMELGKGEWCIPFFKMLVSAVSICIVGFESSNSLGLRIHCVVVALGVHTKPPVQIAWLGAVRHLFGSSRGRQLPCSPAKVDEMELGEGLGCIILSGCLKQRCQFASSWL